MRKVILGTLVAIVLIGGALTVERSIRVNRGIPTAADKTGNSLPGGLQVTSFERKTKVRLDHFKGKVVLINFWASWCEACMAEMPSIQKLYDTFKESGLEVLAVNLDEKPDRAVPQIISRLKLSFPIFIDPDGELARTFQVVAIPFSIVADKEQKIVWSESGERDWASDEVKEEIKKLL